MKLFKKSTISLAMTAALIGGVMATQQASAYEDLHTGGETRVTSNGVGQALVYPHYTVNEGWTTNINVINTSSTHAVAVKVRFRESQNSRDVLDFNLVLSPNDKWSGTVKEAGAGVVLTTADASCTIPAIPANGAPFSSDGYGFVNPNAPAQQSFRDSGTQTEARLKEGYAEILPMAWSSDILDTVYMGALHSQTTGIPGSCANVRAAFVPTDVFGNGVNEALVPARPSLLHGTGRPTIASDISWTAIPTGSNPLRGSMVLINKEGGVAGGTNAVAIADWMQGLNLLTAQEFPFYLEPTLASAGGLWTIDGLVDTDEALAASTVANEWAENPLNGADQDWVITYPTKSFHVDIESVPGGNIQAGRTDYRLNGATLGALAPFTNAFTGGTSEISIVPEFYDLEEGEPTGGAGSVSFSPGSFSSSVPTLKYESNVITFGGTSVLSASAPLNLDPVGDIKGLTSGWMALGTPGDGSLLGDPGLPTVGFTIKTRNAGDATLSFGQIMDHSYAQ
ncbi:MAG: hypothetical protein ACI88H_003671 [Cocleimonas sp.]|jgi:hypothetical protein